VVYKFALVDSGCFEEEFTCVMIVLASVQTVIHLTSHNQFSIFTIINVRIKVSYCQW